VALGERWGKLGAINSLQYNHRICRGCDALRGMLYIFYIYIIERGTSEDKKTKDRLKRECEVGGSWQS